MANMTRFSCLLLPFLFTLGHALAQRRSAHPNPADPFTHAHWIEPAATADTLQHPCPVFRKTFTVTHPTRSATLFITAHGLYQATLNGRPLSHDLFTPGFTNYHRRLQYQQYAIGNLIRPGKNEIQVTVGEGWYLGEFGADLKKGRYGQQAGLLFRLVIRFADGSHQTISSDSSWQSAPGPIIHSGIYNGELTDTRINPTDWSPVRTHDEPNDNLVPSTSPPVREHEHFQPTRLFTSPKGETILDFGQNLAGWVRFAVTGQPGDTVRLSHAETLDAAGNFYTGNLRLAEAQDVYILRGGTQTLQPNFTYHGFRYVRIDHYPGKARPENFTAVALYSDLPHAGDFSCSDSLINRLQANINWSQKSNFFEIPTDCPQRSERFGWTGDAQMFCRTASFNQNVNAFYEKWLADLASSQGTNGGLPNYIPDFRYPDTIGPRGGVAGWGDATTIIPWTLYQVYGDTAMLRRQYASMKAWVNYQLNHIDPVDHIWEANGYGDWYAPGPQTDIGYIDQCFLIHSLELLDSTEKIISPNGAKNVIDQAALPILKQAFQRDFFGPDGLPIPNTQTACVLALQFHLLPDTLQPLVARRLAKLIHDNSDHLATGFLGTPYILWALSDNGYSDLAFTLLHQTTPPSWLYPLTKDATTIWEKWEAIKPDGSFDTCSLNHYAYGAVGDWLYRFVAGIDAIAPGYKIIKITPHPGGGLSWVKARYRCPYGKIVSNWTIKSGELSMHVEIPPHTTAIITIPGKRPMTVHAGTHQFKTRI
jgi:alpha-L-rhamnosidase